MDLIPGSLFHFLTKILSFVWPLLGLASVFAGVLFVRALPRAYNWSFLAGACIQVLGGMVFPLITLSNRAAELMPTYYTYVSGINLVGGILLAYGIIGHAVSYSKMAITFRQSDSNQS